MNNYRATYWARAKRELSERDPVLAQVIQRFPKAKIVSRGDPFQTLARSIVGQQISVKAAQSVWQRFEVLCQEHGPEEFSPKKVHGIPVEKLRTAGFSQRKCEYMRDLAQHFFEGRLQVERWPQMTDDEIIEDLVRVRGIGRWTAEMFLIFTLMRPNVLPVDDIGLQRAVQLSYGLRKRPSEKTLRRIAKAWQPWCSVATWFLWRSLDPIPVEY